MHMGVCAWVCVHIFGGGVGAYECVCVWVCVRMGVCAYGCVCVYGGCVRA